MSVIISFIVGAAVAIGSVYFAKLLSDNNKEIKIHQSQSRSFSLLLPIMQPLLQYEDLDTQATRFYDSNMLRILYFKDKAYWIKDNAVYCAPVQDGLVAENSEEKLDIINMDKVELEEMIFIIETLTEGLRDDRWNTGD